MLLDCAQVLRPNHFSMPTSFLQLTIHGDKKSKHDTDRTDASRTDCTDFCFRCSKTCFRFLMNSTCIALEPVQLVNAFTS